MVSLVESPDGGPVIEPGHRRIATVDDPSPVAEGIAAGEDTCAPELELAGGADT